LGAERALRAMVAAVWWIALGDRGSLASPCQCGDRWPAGRSGTPKASPRTVAKRDHQINPVIAADEAAIALLDASRAPRSKSSSAWARPASGLALRAPPQAEVTPTTHITTATATFHDSASARPRQVFPRIQPVERGIQNVPSGV